MLSTEPSPPAVAVRGTAVALVVTSMAMLLAVAVAPVTAAEPAGAHPAPAEEHRLERALAALVAALEREEIVHGLVGRDDARRLEEARFRLDLLESWPGSGTTALWESGWERRQREWIGETMGDVGVEVVRELVENSGPVRRMRVRLERARPESATGGGEWGGRWTVEPRADVGGNRYLGARISLHGLGGPLWRRATLDLRNGLDRGEHLVRLRFTGARSELVLEHAFGSGRDGREIGVGVRIGF